MTETTVAQEGFAVLDRIPVGMCVLGSDFKILFWNSPLESWTGLSRADVVNSDIRDRLADLARAKGPRQEMPAEQQVRELNRQIEFILEATRTHLDIIDSQFNIRYVDPGREKTYGQAQGRKCYEYFMGRQSACPGCRIQRALETKQVAVTEESLVKEGNRPVQVTTIPFQDARGEWLVAEVNVDISERKRIEANLEQIHDQTKMVLDSLSSLMVTLDDENRVLQWNLAAANTLGISEGQVIGRRLEEFPIGWDSQLVSRQIERCRRQKAQVRFDDMHLARCDGSQMILGLTANPVCDGTGRATGVLLQGADVTQRRLLETQLAHSQKLEAMGQLAAGIAHEINTPAQYVGDNTRFLQEEFGRLMDILRGCHRMVQDAREGSVSQEAAGQLAGAFQEADVDYLFEEIPKAIQQSMEGIARVTKIVRAMKEFSHPDTDEKTSADLNKLIESTVTVCRNEWKYVADLELDLDSGLPRVSCLPGQVNQVILNLVLNAAQAIEEALGERPANKGKITVSTRRDGAFAEIRIADTGCGIPEHARRKVYDLFFTTKEVGKGTGQGLTIARSVVVEKHGGAIDFQTEVGKGTTFIVRLPIEDVRQPEATAPAEASHA